MIYKIAFLALLIAITFVSQKEAKKWEKVWQFCTDCDKDKTINDFCCQRPEKIWKENPDKKICCEFPESNGTVTLRPTPDEEFSPTISVEDARNVKVECGSTIWKDKPYVISSFSPELAGLTLFQIAYEVAVPTIEIVSNKDATVFIALSNDVSNTVGDALKAQSWTLDLGFSTHFEHFGYFLEGEDPTEKDLKKFESMYSKNINSENPITLNRAKVIPNPGIVQFALLIREKKHETYRVIHKMTFDGPIEKDNFDDNIDKFKEAFKVAFKEALSSLPPEFKILDREIYLELNPFSPFNAIAVYITKELYYAEARKIKKMIFKMNHS